MLEFKLPFMLFSTCIPVKGFNRSIIYDLQRMSFEYIPNSLYDLIIEFEGNSIEDIFTKYDDSEKTTIEEYFTFLFENEYIFFLRNTTRDNFPKLNTVFDSPHHFLTFVLDIKKSKANSVYMNLVNEQIKECLVATLVLRLIDKDFTKDEVIKILDYLNDIPTRIIHLFIDEECSFDESDYHDFLESNKRISIILIYNSKENFGEKLFNTIWLEGTRKNIFLDPFIGNDSIKDFFVNMEHFVEAKNKNTYFNKRCYIDERGFISRFEKDLENFGNIDSTKVIDLIDNTDFVRYWNVTKNEIKVCRDCEYRFMCTDGRLPIQKNKIYELEGECNYSPYTSSWK